jgi:hypothetical protein
VSSSAEHMPSDVNVIVYLDPKLGISHQPACANVPGAELISRYGATKLIHTAAQYLYKQLNVPANSIHHSPDNRFHVWHRFYLHHHPLCFALEDTAQCDVVRACPVLKDGRCSQWGPGVFDTALFIDKPKGYGVHCEYSLCVLHILIIVFLQ